MSMSLIERMKMAIDLNGKPVEIITSRRKLSTESAFCVLQHDGRIIVWGCKDSGGDMKDVKISDNIQSVVATRSAFCALDQDGRAFYWGEFRTPIFFS
eukprot:UN28309